MAIEWASSAKADRMVDSIGLLIMELEELQYRTYVAPDTLSITDTTPDEAEDKFKVLKDIIEKRFENVESDEKTRTIAIKCGEDKASVNCATLVVDGSSDLLRQTLDKIVQQVESSMSPMLIP